MDEHKYKIGQKVKFLNPIGRTTVEEDFEVTRLLPSDRTNVLYRIKGADTGQERVVTEVEIE
jgi:hypothetical protein